MADKDFFLSPDDSQTLGDINYMRKSVRVRRTFPKTLKNKDGFAVEKEVSATQAQNDSFNSNGATNFNSVSKGNASASSQTDFKATAGEINAAKPAETENKEQRRQVDSNLDMFRNMARSMKRR